MSVQPITAEGQLPVILSATKGLVVVHFSAGWAPQCKDLNAVLEELAKIHTSAQFFKIEAEELPVLSLEYEVVAVPTVLFFKGGALASRVNGANPALIASNVEKLVIDDGTTPTAPAAAPAAPAQPKEDLNTRLKKLINAAPVMLFMKGSPAEARCGFSKQIVALLQEQNVEFSSFDILADEEVRQGLKTFSNWPTFPQLYVSGSLVGGLDIVKELIASGEFKEVLPKKASEESLNEKLKILINQQPVMLFMKGTPDAPRCGFSAKIVKALRDEGASFGHYDILGDDEVRQGLKKFSNWPTYPQLYVNGSLIGGLDIVNELKDAGELKATLGL